MQCGEYIGYMLLKCTVSSIVLGFHAYLSLSPLIPSPPPPPLSSSLISSLHSDTSFTLVNVLHATSDVEYDDLRGCLVVPATVYAQINANPSYPTEEKRREAMVAYYLNIAPVASWATLAGRLYYWGKRVSLEAVRKYLHHTTG